MEEAYVVFQNSFRGINVWRAQIGRLRISGAKSGVLVIWINSIIPQGWITATLSLPAVWGERTRKGGAKAAASPLAGVPAWNVPTPFLAFRSSALARHPALSKQNWRRWQRSGEGLSGSGSHWATCQLPAHPPSAIPPLLSRPLLDGEGTHCSGSKTNASSSGLCVEWHREGRGWWVPNATQQRLRSQKLQTPV